jgi:hypothetical protein
MQADTLEARLAAQYCQPGTARWIVVLYTDDAGNVGGYRAGLAIMDSPIVFYGADGTALGSFHIFAPPDENARSKAAIDALKERFPNERPLACPPSSAR